jgi:ankyrin repeat protein
VYGSLYILNTKLIHVFICLPKQMAMHDLVLVGGDLRLRNNKGETPISIAVSRGQVSVVEYLANSKFTGSDLSFRLGVQKRKKRNYTLG